MSGNWTSRVRQKPGLLGGVYREREQPNEHPQTTMPITVDNVSQMLTIAASAAGMTLEQMLAKIYAANPDCLPKPLLAVAKGVPTAEPVREKSVWARKSTKEYAEAIGIKESDVKVRTGLNNTIVLVDVKVAFKEKKLAERARASKAKAKEAAVAVPIAPPVGVAVGVPEPQAEAEEDEGDEFAEEY